MPDQKEKSLFISYSHGDEGWASEFVDALKSEGVQAWFDKADIKAGELLSEKMEQALRDSDVVIALVSHNYVRSPSTFFELGAAVGDNKRIIPVLTQDVGEMELPSLLRGRRRLQESSPKLAGKLVAEAIGLLSRDERLAQDRGSEV